MSAGKLGKNRRVIKDRRIADWGWRMAAWSLMFVIGLVVGHSIRREQPPVELTKYVIKYRENPERQAQFEAAVAETNTCLERINRARKALENGERAEATDILGE